MAKKIRGAGLPASKAGHEGNPTFSGRPEGKPEGRPEIVFKDLVPQQIPNGLWKLIQGAYFKINALAV